MSAIDELEGEIIGFISARILAHPRSLQEVIGPSEMGTPCLRRLGFKLSGTPAAQIDVESIDIPWRPTVGTAIHSWMADTFAGGDEAQSRIRAVRDVFVSANESYAHELDEDGACTEPWCPYWAQESEIDRLPHLDRFVVELNTVCFTLRGIEHAGTLDLYDRLTKTIVDWKVNGVTALREYRRNGPGRGYKTQLHIYARGCSRGPLRLPVEHVAIMFLPMAGELRDHVWWTEPYDPIYANGMVARARNIIEQGDDESEGGWETLLPALETANDHCPHCPWFRPGSKDPSVACPGDPSMLLAKPGDQFSDLLG